MFAPDEAPQRDRWNHSPLQRSKARHIIQAAARRTSLVTSRHDPVYSSARNNAALLPRIAGGHRAGDRHPGCPPSGSTDGLASTFPAIYAGLNPMIVRSWRNTGIRRTRCTSRRCEPRGSSPSMRSIVTRYARWRVLGRLRRRAHDPSRAGSANGAGDPCEAGLAHTQAKLAIGVLA
jgi:hypothetical protein